MSWSYINPIGLMSISSQNDIDTTNPSDTYYAKSQGQGHYLQYPINHAHLVTRTCMEGFWN